MIDPQVLVGFLSHFLELDMAKHLLYKYSYCHVTSFVTALLLV